MRKASLIKIISLSVIGFKKFKEYKEIELDDINFVYGRNSIGKSSIANAIAYAFVGTCSFGGNRLDKLLNEESKEMVVCAKFVDDLGEIHELTQAYNGKTTELTLNGNKATQSIINERFGDKDTFLSILNPLYFAEVMGNASKNFLENLLPVIDHKAIIGLLDDKSKEILADEKLYSPETYIINRREELKELEKDLIFTEGQAELRIENKKNALLRIKEAQEKIVAYDEEIEILEKMKVDTLSEQEKEELPNLYSRLEEALKEKQVNTNPDALKAELANVKTQMDLLREKKFVSTNLETISMLKAENASLKTGYEKALQLFKDAAPDFMCPTCLQLISTDKVEPMKELLKSQIEEMATKAKNNLNKYNEITQSDLSLRQSFEQELTDQIAMLESQEREIEFLLNGDNSPENESISKLRNSIALLEEKMKNNGLTEAENTMLNEFISAKTACEAEIKVYKDQVEKDEKSAGDTTIIKEDISILERKIDSAFKYIGKKNELLFKELRLNKVKFKLYEVIKTTGEIKDTFKVTYDGKDYQRLSLSEKIKAGLELSNMIKNLTGKCYPTFIDNWESVCTLDNVRPTGQLIFSFVDKEAGADLTVHSQANEVRKAA